jgi:hypothetical protein
MIPQNIAEQLLNWEKSGKNYSPTLNWTELNDLAIKSGNQPFNLGCGECRRNLLEYLLAVIKENETNVFK